MKTYDPISVNLINKFLSLLFSFFSLSSPHARSPPLPIFFFPKMSLASSLFDFSLPLLFLFYFIFLFRFFYFNFFFKILDTYGSHYAMYPSLIRIRFYPKTIHFFSIQFILTELSSSYFLTSDIFIKISFMASLLMYKMLIKMRLYTDKTQ